MNDLAEPLLQQAPPPQLEVFSPGALLMNPQKMRDLMAFAEMMSKAAIAVPNHLRGKPSDCLAICMQAMQWNMNPFAVAQKTHLVNGQLGYEAQLVNAVVQTSGAIVGHFRYEYTGAGATVACRVGAVLRGDKDVTWGEWYGAEQVQTKNSPLWKTNPKQQLGYLQVKNWARQYAPGAILGVYTTDESETVERVDDEGDAPAAAPAQSFMPQRRTPAAPAPAAALPLAEDATVIGADLFGGAPAEAVPVSAPVSSPAPRPAPRPAAAPATTSARAQAPADEDAGEETGELASPGHKARLEHLAQRYEKNLEGLYQKLGYSVQSLTLTQFADLKKAIAS